MEASTNLTKRIQELEGELRRKTEWAETAEKYISVEVAKGIFAMLQNNENKNYQSATKLCINCFESQQKSVLQQAASGIQVLVLTCS